MDVLHRIAIVLISLVAWSGGVTLANRHEAPALPGLSDALLAPALAALMVFWAGTLGHWTSIAATLLVGLGAGAVSGWTRRLAGTVSDPSGTGMVLRARKSNSAGTEDRRGFRDLMERIGNFQGRLLMHLLYFLVLGPFALIARMGTDPLHRQAAADGGTHWRDPESRSSGSDDPTQAY